MGAVSSIRPRPLHLVPAGADVWGVQDDREERGSAERAFRFLEGELRRLPAGSALASTYRAWLRTLRVWLRLRP